MEDFFQLTDLLNFMKPIKSLTHHLRGPPSPKTGEGFQCIDFIYQIDLFDVNQPLASLPSP